jgi:hypothetical protein
LPTNPQAQQQQQTVFNRSEIWHRPDSARGRRRDSADALLCRRSRTFRHLYAVSDRRSHAHNALAADHG